MRVAHAPRMPGSFSSPTRVSVSDIHRGTCMAGSLTSGFLSVWWRGKRPQHSRRMHNPQFYISGESLVTRWPQNHLISILTRLNLENIHVIMPQVMILILNICKLFIDIFKIVAKPRTISTSPISVTGDKGPMMPKAFPCHDASVLSVDLTKRLIRSIAVVVIGGI